MNVAPAGLNGITAIAAGYEDSLALGNPVPFAQDQPVTTEQDIPVDITLAATNFYNDPLTYSILTPPAKGTLAGEAPNLTYTPPPGYIGPDSFTFKANDGIADTNIATVSIAVVPVNIAPVAQSQAITTYQDIPVNITLVATDDNGDLLTYSIFAPHFNGSLSGSAPELTYTPAPGYVGEDSFTFSAYDGKVDSNLATISITVKDVPLPALTLSLTPTRPNTAILVRSLPILMRSKKRRGNFIRSIRYY